MTTIPYEKTYPAKPLQLSAVSLPWRWADFPSTLVKCVEGGTPDDWCAIEHVVFRQGMRRHQLAFEQAFRMALNPQARHRSSADLQGDRKVPLAGHIANRIREKERKCRAIHAYLVENGISTATSIAAVMDFNKGTTRSHLLELERMGLARRIPGMERNWIPGWQAIGEMGE